MTPEMKNAAMGGLVGAVVAVVIVFAAASLGLLPGNDAAMHDYLLAHPEIVVAMTDKLQAQQEADEDRASQNAVTKLGMKAFFDPRLAYITGPAKAKRTVVEFFDYNCPYCRQMLPTIAQAEAADPLLRVVYKVWPILGTSSIAPAKAALAANKQGQFIALHRALYQLRGEVDESKALTTAQSIGLDMERLKSDMQSTAIEATVKRNLALAGALGIDGTPGFVIGTRVLIGPIELSALQAAIQSVR